MQEKNIKKFIFGITVGFFLILSGLLFFIFKNFDDKDFCLDTGNCKEGQTINTANGMIIVDIKNCIQNNGEWVSDKNLCKFKK